MEVSILADPISTPFSLLNSLSSPLISAAVAPPPRKPTHRRRSLVQRRRRTRRASDLVGDDYDGDGGGFFGDGNGWNYGGGNGWSSGGGNGPYGGGGWSSGDGWKSSEDGDDPAFDFVYGVMCWVALSNCLHFAVKKVVRVGGDSEREKLRIASIC